MQKDLKIGLAFGLVLITAVFLWLSTRPSLSTQARMLDLGTVSSQKPVNAPPRLSNTSPLSTETIAAKPEPPIEGPVPQTTKFHIVQKGDTLSKISSIYYGTANNWQKILNANRNIIKDMNKLTPGTKLTIPQ